MSVPIQDLSAAERRSALASEDSGLRLNDPLLAPAFREVMIRAWDLSQRPAVGYPKTLICHRDRPNEIFIRDPALLSDDACGAADYPGGPNEGYADSFKQCFKRLYERIKMADYSSPHKYPTFEDGHREIALCEAIHSSVKTGGWVNVRGATQ